MKLASPVGAGLHQIRCSVSLISSSHSQAMTHFQGNPVICIWLTSKLLELLSIRHHSGLCLILVSKFLDSCAVILILFHHLTLYSLSYIITIKIIVTQLLSYFMNTATHSYT